MAVGFKTGGRQKGTPNKRTERVLETLERLKCEPLELLVYFAQNNEKALGYEGPQIKILKDGGMVETPWITPEMRLQAVGRLCDLVYPKLKALEISTDDDSPIDMNVSIDSNTLGELVKVARGK